MSDRLATLTPQEVERITVFRLMHEPLPILPEDGTVAVIVDPSTNRIVEHVFDMDSTIRPIRRQGFIAFAVADVPNWDREDVSAEPYWTIERAQRFYDHHRWHYVNGD